MTIGEFIKQTTNKLSEVGISTARLDTLVLLADALHKDKAWLLAHVEQVIPADTLRKLEAKTSARAKRKPMAYIRGKQEFYGREFRVGKHVLIPRPDSEAIIDLLKPLAANNPGVLIDVGTGSGALGITAALECPNLEVLLTDIDSKTLAVANRNARRFKLQLQSLQSDLLKNYTGKADYILANLPYVDREWQTSTETNFEPSLALYADDNGLELINRLLQQVPAVLKPGGYLLLEADPRQHLRITDFAKEQDLDFTDQSGFALVFRANTVQE